MISDEKILLVDDDALFALGLRSVLSIYNDFSHAPSLAAAREWLVQVRAAEPQKGPTLVLLDFHLPDGVGPDLLGELKALHPAPTVVLLSGENDFDKVNRALLAGADDYLVKSDQVLPDLLVRIPVARAHARAKTQQKRLEGSLTVPLPREAQDLNPAAYQEFLFRTELSYLKHSIELSAGDIGLAATRLGLARSTVFRKLALETAR